MKVPQIFQKMAYQIFLDTIEAYMLEHENSGLNLTELCKLRDECIAGNPQGNVFTRLGQIELDLKRQIRVNCIRWLEKAKQQDPANLNIWNGYEAKLIQNS
jgi:hypothetical protein